MWAYPHVRASEPNKAETDFCTTAAEKHVLACLLMVRFKILASVSVAQRAAHFQWG